MASGLLTCELFAGDADRALGVWSRMGTLGCEETAGETTVRFAVYFRDVAAAQKAAGELARAGICAAVKIAAVEDRDWNAQWRATLQPVQLTDGIWVSPRWLPPPAADGGCWICIEPRMAFGTGHHESTRLAAKAMSRLIKFVAQPSVLDVGAGSGVLCFAASSMGAARCLGVERDLVCRENLAENRRDNPRCCAVAFVICSVDALKPRAWFDIAVMNLILTEGTPCLAQVARLVKPGGALAWSGLLADDRDAAVRAARTHGFAPAHEDAENEWICCSFTRTDAGGGE